MRVGWPIPPLWYMRPCRWTLGSGVGGMGVDSRVRSEAGRESVLLVDDHDDVRMLTRIVLERLGFAVIEASDGAQALAECRRPDVTFDLLLTDVSMPGMDGLELAHRVQALRPDVAVLFASGERGAVPDHQLLLKPFRIAEVETRVRRALEARRPTP
jgi:CheY-like chemotaxis protein